MALKLTLSKTGDPRGKHLVVLMPIKEHYDVLHLLEAEVTRGKRVEREFDRSTEQVRLRFHIRYLEKLMLTIPFASLSEGIEKMLLKAEMERLASMPIPELQVPGMVGELWDFQKVMVEKLANEEIDLDNDEMGLGKTFSILAALAMRRQTVLDAGGSFQALVCVGSVAGKYVWEREAAEHFPKLSVQVVEGTALQRRKQINSGADITIVNTAALRIKRWIEPLTHELVEEVLNPDLFKIDWEIFIVDEYHKFKNPSAQQTVGFLKMECGRFIGASGTPIMNRPEEAWSFMHKIDPEEFPTYYNFEQRIAVTNKAGHIVGYNPTEMLKLKNWLATHSLRRRKEHVRNDLPEVIRSDQLVALTPEQRRLYNKIKNDFELEMENGDVNNVTQARVRVMRLKQACFSPELYGGSSHSGKIDQIKQDVADLVASGEKAIIFSEWARAARILQRELAEYNPAYVDGSVPAKRRMAECDKFNNETECHLYIGTIKANQEAITLSSATYVLFADEDWTPTANAQAEARSASGGMRGIGVTGQVNIIRYQAEDTIEQRLAERLYKKQKTFNAMIERDAGVSLKKLSIRALRELL